MSKDLLTLYKMIVLYMLEKASSPLTRAQISDFILDKEYTDYMTLQTVFSDLTEDGFITAEETENRTIYEITPEGAETLEFFGGRLSEDIRDDIKVYLKQNEVQIIDELSVKTNYDRNSKGEYIAELTLLERESQLMNMSVTVPSKELAERVCNNWKTQNEEIYQYLIGKLF
ncbi:MAG: DUF4364 family protein [Lachnospiraceae bacterium]|nr:DUF4364 family protein [Candidatus Merdinaster equi]